MAYPSWSEIKRLERERDEARAIARAYQTDNRPPAHMVTQALAYPVKP